MSQKTFNLITGVLFAIISLLHLVRSIFEWPANIGTFSFPVGLSVIAFLVTGFISYSAFKLYNKTNISEIK